MGKDIGEREINFNGGMGERGSVRVQVKFNCVIVSFHGSNASFVTSRVFVLCPHFKSLPFLSVLLGNRQRANVCVAAKSFQSAFHGPLFNAIITQDKDRKMMPGAKKLRDLS